jgi:hypothetical protein
VYEIVLDVRDILNLSTRNYIYSAPLLGRYFPGSQTIWDILPVCRSMSNEEVGSSPGFEECYLSCISPRFKPRTTNNFIQFTFTPDDWRIVNWAYINKPEYAWDDRAEWLNGKDWEWIGQKKPSASSFLDLMSQSVHIRIPKEIVEKKCMTHGATMRLHFYIWRLQSILKTSFDEVTDVPH